MSSIKCGNRNCKYLGGLFCGNEFAFLNQYGQCKVWFDDNGQFRGQPLYPSDGKPIEASEQRFPQQENNGTSEGNFNDSANATPSEENEKREDN